MIANFDYQEGKAKLTGEINFATAASLLNASRGLFQTSANKPLEIDFSHLTMLQNSVAIALIIEWIKLKEQYQVDLHLKGISSSLLALAKVAGVATLIESVILMPRASL